MSKKQTSVGWLAEWILANTKRITDLSDAEFDLKYQEALQTARQMHREEVEEAYIEGDEIPLNAEQYYTRTFETP